MHNGDATRKKQDSTCKTRTTHCLKCVEEGFEVFTGCWSENNCPRYLHFITKTHTLHERKKAK